MRRQRRREGLYRSGEVAKILGISARTLYRRLAKGEIAEPMRDPANGYRVWTVVDLDQIREAWRK